MYVLNNRERTGVNYLLMKYSIPLAWFAAVKTFADGVNAEFTVKPRSLMCSHFLSSIYLSPLRKRLNDDRGGGGFLLLDDGFYSHLTEGPIHEADKVFAELFYSLGTVPSSGLFGVGSSLLPSSRLASLKMEALSRYWLMFVSTILSTILHITEVRQIGL